MNDDEKGYLYDREGMLMRQRNMAEEERDALTTTITNLRDQLVLAEGQRDQAKMRAEAVRAEVEALREQLKHQSYTLTAEHERAERTLFELQEPSTSVLIAMQSADSHGDVTDAQCIEMLRAALTAALAVQCSKDLTYPEFY